MKKVFVLSLFAALLLSFTFSLTARAADDDKVFDFKISLSYPENDPFFFGYTDMKKFMEASGKFKVEIFANSELSASEPEAFQQTIDNMIQMTQGPTYVLAALSGVNGYYVYDYPGLMNSTEEFHRVAASPLAEDLAAQALKSTGLMVGRAWLNGWCAIGTSADRDLTTLEGLNGLKVRSMTSDITVPWLRKLGLNAVAMAFSEIYTGLQQKTVDGVYTPIRFFWSHSFGEQCRNILWDKSSGIMQVPVVNHEYFQSLPEGHQKVLLEAMEIFSDSVHKHAMDWEDKSYDYLVNDLKLNVVIPDDAMKAELQKRANELLAETSEVAGQKYVDWAKEILGKK